MHFEIVCEIVILVCGCVLQQVLDTARAGQENGVFPCCPSAPSLLAFRDKRKECSMCLDRLGSFSSGAVPFFFCCVHVVQAFLFSARHIFWTLAEQSLLIALPCLSGPTYSFPGRTRQARRENDMARGGKDCLVVKPAATRQVVG